MPVLITQDSTMIILPVDYSQKAIEREFDKLTRIDFCNVEAHLYMHKKGVFAAVVKAEPNSKGRHNCIAKIDFVSVPWSKALVVDNFFEKEPAQVEGVVVDDSYRNGQLAFSMYEYLVAEHGLNIISDSEQYAGGQAIWKKLARESTKLNVYPFDVETQRFFPCPNGDNLIYDGENISDDTLWSLDPDRSKERVVLIAKA